MDLQNSVVPSTVLLASSTGTSPGTKIYTCLNNHLNITNETVIFAPPASCDRKHVAMYLPKKLILIYLSNPTFKLHMPICLCAYETTMSAYIAHMNHCNQQYDKYWYT